MRKSAKMRKNFVAVVRCDAMRILIPFSHRIRISHFFALFRIFALFFTYFAHFSRTFHNFLVKYRPKRWKKCESAKKVRKVRCNYEMRMRCENSAMQCDELLQKVRMRMRCEKVFALPSLARIFFVSKNLKNPLIIIKGIILLIAFQHLCKTSKNNF